MDPSWVHGPVARDLGRERARPASAHPRAGAQAGERCKRGDGDEWARRALEPGRLAGAQATESGPELRGYPGSLRPATWRIWVEQSRVELSHSVVRSRASRGPCEHCRPGMGADRHGRPRSASLHRTRRSLGALGVSHPSGWTNWRVVPRRPCNSVVSSRAAPALTRSEDECKSGPLGRELDVHAGGTAAAIDYRNRSSPRRLRPQVRVRTQP